MQDAQLTIRAGRITDPRQTWTLVVLVALAGSPMVLHAEEASQHDLEIGETTVQVHPSAVVTSEVIRLGDIGTIEGPRSSRAAEWVIVSGLKPEGSYVVTVDALEQALRRHGVNLGLWVFRGHSQCTVQRAGQAADGKDSTQDGPILIGESLASQMPGVPAYLRGVEPNSLEADLRRHLAQRMARLGGTPVIRFSAMAERYLKLTKPTYDFKIVDETDRLVGMVSMRVTVSEGDLVRQTLSILAEVILEKEVVVATRPMNRGHVIQESDVTLRTFPFKNLNDVTLTETQPLIGQQAKKLIKEGERITPRDIEPVPLVKRNDLVVVWVRRGGLVIKYTAKALESGGYGETVELKNLQTRKYFTGVVTGHETVELPGAPPEETLTLVTSKEKK